MRTTATTLQVLVQQRGSNNNGEYLFEVAANGLLSYWDYDTSAGGTKQVAIYSTGKVNDGNWHLCCVTRKSGVLTFWIDGVESGSNSSYTANPAMLSTTCPLAIGTDYRDHTYYFSGNIAQVFIYSRALQASEVLGIYQSRIAF